jgi:hypothetical protein
VAGVAKGPGSHRKSIPASFQDQFEIAKSKSPPKKAGKKSSMKKPAKPKSQQERADELMANKRRLVVRKFVASREAMAKDLLCKPAVMV